MTLRLPIHKENYLTFISTYAPTIEADKEAKNQFKQQLSYTIVNIPPKDNILLLG